MPKIDNIEELKEFICKKNLILENCYYNTYLSSLDTYNMIELKILFKEQKTIEEKPLINTVPSSGSSLLSKYMIPYDNSKYNLSIVPELPSGSLLPNITGLASYDNKICYDNVKYDYKYDYDRPRKSSEFKPPSLKFYKEPHECIQEITL